MMKKYKSRYGANSDITAAQYLVEFMMERIAKKEKTTLPFKFWNIPRWNKVFRMQIKYANELLSEYSEEEVFAALKTKRGQRIFSLGAKKTMIVPLIEENRKKKQDTNQQTVTVTTLDEWLEEHSDSDDELRKSVGKKDENLFQETKNLWSQLG